MNLETLKLFLDISRLRSISKAAQKSHITQSALSQQLKSWETALGVELLQRSNKGAQLTEAGEIAQRYAAQICKLYEDMVTEIGHIKPRQQQLSIYAIPEVCNYALPCTLYEIKNRFPYCDISLNEASSPLIEEHILLEEAEVGFISGPSVSSGLVSHKVFSDEVVLVSGGSKPAPLEIHVEELARYPLIGSPQLSCVQDSLAQALTSSPVLSFVYSLDSIEAVKLAAARGHGAAFLPYMSIKKELYNKQLKPIRIHNFQVYNDIHMVKKQQPPRGSKDLLQLIQYIEQTLVDTLC